MADDTQTPPATALPGATVTAQAPDLMSGDPRAAMRRIAGGYIEGTTASDRALQDIYKQYQPQIAQAEKGMEESGKVLSETTKNAPKAEPLPKADFQTRQMGAAATMGLIVMGLLAGRAAHTGALLTTADAVGKAYRAYDENDQRRLAAAEKQWQAGVEEMKARNAAMREAYNDALETAKTNVTLADQKLKFLQQSYFDALTQQYNKETSLQGRAKTMGDFVSKSEQIAHQAEMAKLEFSRLREERRYHDLQTGAGGVGINPKVVDGVASQIKETGDFSLLSKVGSRGARGQAMREAVLEKLYSDPTVSAGELAKAALAFKGAQAEESKLAQRTVGVDIAAKETSGAAKIALDASAKVPREGYVGMVNFENWYRTQSQDPAMAQFAVANQTLVNAYAAAANRGLGVSTNYGKQHAEEILGTSKDEASYRAAVEQVQKETDMISTLPGVLQQEYLDRYGEQAIAAPAAAKSYVYNPDTGELEAQQ